MVTFVSSGNFYNDKEWITAGPNGKVVVTWTRFSFPPRGLTFQNAPIVGAFSSDYSKTWNRKGFPISDAAHPFNEGSQVQYGPDGALYVAYEAAAPATGYMTDVMVLARSTNDGLTFATKELARVYDDLDCYPIYDGRQTLTDMHFRLNSFPSMSIDPVSGRIAITWADNQGSGTCGSGGSSFSGTTANQVKLVSGTWDTISSAPVTAVTTSAQDKVFPSVASRNGTNVVSYYTRDYGITSGAAVCNVRTIIIRAARFHPHPLPARSAWITPPNPTGTTSQPKPVFPLKVPTRSSSLRMAHSLVITHRLLSAVTALGMPPGPISAASRV